MRRSSQIIAAMTMMTGLNTAIPMMADTNTRPNHNRALHAPEATPPTLQPPWVILT